MESDLEFILKTYILQKNPLPLDEIEKVLKEETASKENLQASIQIPQPYLVKKTISFQSVHGDLGSMMTRSFKIVISLH